MANANYCISGLEDWVVVTRPLEMDVEVTKVVADHSESLLASKKYIYIIIIIFKSKDLE